MEERSVWARCAVLSTGSEDAISRLLSEGVAEDCSIDIIKDDDHYIPECVMEEECGESYEWNFDIGENITVGFKS